MLLPWQLAPDESRPRIDKCIGITVDDNKRRYYTSAGWRVREENLLSSSCSGLPSERLRHRSCRAHRRRLRRPRASRSQGLRSVSSMEGNLTAGHNRLLAFYRTSCRNGELYYFIWKNNIHCNLRKQLMLELSLMCAVMYVRTA